MHTHDEHCDHTHHDCHGHHHHHHHHADDMKGAKLLWATFLNFSITIVQIIGGIVSNSLSLISDAIHNLGDSSAIFIAFLAGKRARKQPDEKKTFGYKRTEILAALFNAIVLIAICIYLFFEAYQRFVNPEPIKGNVKNSVGAGDSMVAGFITGFEKTDDLQEALYWGISSGSASAYSENLATLAEVEALLSQVRAN